MNELAKKPRTAPAPSRVTACILSALFTLACLAGCQTNSADSAKEKVSVCAYNVSLMAEYAPYVESQLPDVDIEWIMGNNDLDYYAFLQENGELPDIITARRFSVNDAAPLQPHLLDLSSTETAASFYATYLESYRNADGSVNWLPACGEVDGLIANKALFDRCKIALPTDYESFASACRRFEELGIEGFQTDFAYDYTCMEVLQGASIAQLQTLEGRDWRLAYENGRQAGLDEAVWPEVFKRFSTFMADAGLSSDDALVKYTECCENFVGEKAAIVRGTGVDLGVYRDLGMENVVFLPYFGETEQDNWVLTYPSFQVAASKGADSSDEHREAVLAVLEVMLSDEAQSIIAQEHSAVSYSKDVDLELADELKALEPYVDSNHLYIRLASNDFFSASKDVVGKMLSGEYDAEAAFAAFDAQLRGQEEPVATACRIDQSFSCSFNPREGIPAYSCTANTLREAKGSELLIAPFYTFAGPVLEADYTEKALQYVIGPNSPVFFELELSGAQVEELAQAMVEGGGDTAVVPFSKETLPVTSGFELAVSEGEEGYALDGVSIDGEPLDPARVYSISLVDNVTHARRTWAAAFGGGSSIAAKTSWGEGANPETALPEASGSARSIWTSYVLEHDGQPLGATSYLTLTPLS